MSGCNIRQGGGRYCSTNPSQQTKIFKRASSTRCGASSGHRSRTPASDVVATSHAQHTFRAEAICKFAAREGEKSNLCSRNFVENMFIQAMHAVAGAGGTNPEAKFRREMSMAIWPQIQLRPFDACFSTGVPPSNTANGTSGGYPRD